MWCVYIRRSTPDHPFTFADLIRLQDEILTELKTLPAHQQKAMVFAELAPTVTLGARQVHDENQRAHLQHLTETLKQHGIGLHDGERGGKETWHGPGQWVGFVLTPLEAYTGEARGVRKAVYQILDSVRAAIVGLEPQAKIEDDARLGIWSPRGKLVSIGIKIRDGFISSGFALNCFPHETSFFGIDPCGLSDARPDFLFLNRLESVDYEHEFRRIPARLISFF
jgi:lipoate-protein ligase B